MPKKILGICLALVALAAFVIPVSASASAILRDTASDVLTPLAVGAKFKAIQDEHFVFEAAGVQYTCDHYWMTGEVHTNDTTSGITGTITAAAFNGSEVETKCNGGSLLGPLKLRIPALTNEGGTGHWCIKNKAGLDEFEVLPHGCTQTGGEFTFIFEGNIKCLYVRSAGISGTFTTTSHPSPATLAFGATEFTKETGSSFLCPSSWRITTMKFNLYTEDETTPVEIADL